VAPRSHSWIFQATPDSRDLAAELRGSDTLSWSVARYGRDLRTGDRVYYWQSGGDAGIYGVGTVRDVSPRDPAGRYMALTTHERPLFAPITRAELRGDDDLRGLAVLRQPRGTVFPLSAAQEAALARRIGADALTLALPASRLVGDKARLRSPEDAEIAARVTEARARGDEVLVTIIGADVDGERAVEPARVVSVRAGRNGATTLRIARLPDAPAPPVPETVLAETGAGRVVVMPPALAEPPRVFPAEMDVRGPARADRGVGGSAVARVAEERAGYGAAHGFAPTTAELYGTIVLPPEVAPQLVAAVESGRHIVLMGIPGTGKTSLALNLARAAARAGLCAEPLLATATADWTTFDTIGGLLPAADGALRFSPGVVLRALRDNRWLILDELNRADIDKAFGPLLTVLSGAAVELPTVDAGGRPIRIEPASGPSTLLDDGVTYYAGSDWRIIATMNTLDRAALFAFSLAFARRFAFILTPPPGPAALLALLRARTPLDDAAADFLRRVAEVTPRPLGPAVLLDAAGYIAARGGQAALAEAVGLFVLPQLEGLAPAGLRAFADALAPLLGFDGEALLRAYIGAFNGEG